MYKYFHHRNGSISPKVTQLVTDGAVLGLHVLSLNPGLIHPTQVRIQWTASLGAIVAIGMVIWEHKGMQ